MKLKTKLVILLLMLSITPFLLVSYLSFRIFARELHNNTINKLVAVRNIKSMQIKDYFGTIVEQTSNFANNKIVQDSTAKFNAAFKTLGDDPNQARIGAQNKFYAGSRDKLKQKSEGRYGSPYDVAHKGYHASFANYINKSDFSDIFLVSIDGDVIYSVNKEINFGTNLLTGKFSKSHLSAAFQEITNMQKESPDSKTGKTAGKKSEIENDNRFVFKEFQLDPATESVVAYIARPVIKFNLNIGYIIFQLSPNKISSIMTAREGLGRTGETYLVGQDYLIRSPLLRDDAYHKLENAFAHPNDHKIKTHTIELALKGKTGFRICPSYLHDAVWSAYMPVEIFGVRWAFIAEITQAEVDCSLQDLKKGVYILALITVSIVLVMSFVLSYSVTRPLKSVVFSLKEIANGEGNLKKRLTVKSRDEIGELSKWFNQFIDTLHAIISKISDDAESLNSASSTLFSLSGDIFQGATQMYGTSSQISQDSINMSVRMQSITENMEQSDTSVARVTTASEEISTTIQEISENSEKACSISAEAVTRATDASRMMVELNAAAQEIGKVNKTITDISLKTQLLAFNATIEASRAGKAGKGFAVVAKEVRELSQKTAQATVEIKNKIVSVQESSRNTAAGIERVISIINEIHQIIMVIAGAMQEQSSKTTEIADSVSHTSSEISEASQNVYQSTHVANKITQDINGLTNISRQMKGKTNHLNQNAEGIALLAKELQALIAKFQI